VNGAHQMYIGHQTKILDGSFRKTLIPQNPRIVDENVETPPTVHGLRHHILHLRQVRHVSAMGHRFAAKRLDLGHHIERRLRVCALPRDRAAEVIDHHLGAALGQFNGVASTQATTGTGHQRHFVVISNRHVLSPALLTNDRHAEPLGIHGGGIFPLDLDRDGLLHQKPVRVFAID